MDGIGTSLRAVSNERAQGVVFGFPILRNSALTEGRENGVNLLDGLPRVEVAVGKERGFLTRGYSRSSLRDCISIYSGRNVPMNHFLIAPKTV
jgi:hypothetical protein